MGIATIAFPFTNGVIGFFAEGVFGRIGAAAAQNGGEAPVDAILESILKGFMPFIIAAVVGYLLFVFLIKDYPEQCGAYRDNDKNFTPEMAQAMMIQEIEDRKTTVWTTGHALKNRDFWCASVTCGLLLCGAVGQPEDERSAAAAGLHEDHVHCSASVQCVLGLHHARRCRSVLGCFLCAADRADHCSA